MAARTALPQAPKGKRKINLSDLPQRIPIDEFRKKLLSSKEEPWKPIKRTEKLLKYKVEFGVETGKEEFVKARLKGHDSLDLNSKFAGSVSVLHSGEATRINCLGKSVLGKNYSVVKDKSQGTLFIDHGTRSYLRIPSELEARNAFSEKFVASVKIGKVDKEGKAQAIIQVNRPYQIRYELTLDTNSDYTAFRKDIICNTIGCPELFAGSGIVLDTIVAAGCPVKGAMYMAEDGSNYELISGFTVKGLQWADFDAKEFSIPDGYSSLKQQSRRAKEAEKKTAFAPKVRLSEVRDRQGYQVGKYPDRGTEHGIPGLASFDHHPTYAKQAVAARQFEGGSFKFPTCFNDTYGSLIANLVDQKLLDDLKYIINGVTKRLDDFSGSSGSLNINWMDQFKAHSDALADTDAGGGLYVLLHDETVMGPGYTQKKGMLDKLAIKHLGNLLSNGDNLSGLGLPAALQTTINAIIGNTGIAPSDRFASLTLEDQGSLIDAYVFKRIGTIPLTYPSSSGTQRIFYNLLDVRLDNIEFDININHSAVVDLLEFGSSGIHIVLKLPDASGKAFLSRWPAPLYWAVTGASALACFFFPPACALAATAVIVGIFIGLDFAFVSMDLSNIELDAQITWVPNANNVLQPQVALKLDADVTVYYISVVPTGVHQILSLIYSIVLSFTDIVINQIESQLQDKLNSFVQNDLEISYPPKFGPVPLLGINNLAEFVASDRMYVEQALNAGTLGVISPYITQVDADVKPKIREQRHDFQSIFQDPASAWVAAGSNLLSWVTLDHSRIARYYAGTVLSQNFINHYVYTLWRTFRFNYDFTTDETEKLFNLIRRIFPQFRSIEFDPRVISAHLWPAVPPRTVFTPKPASENKFYSTTFFDDVRICFEVARSKDNRNLEKLEILFAAQTFTELGFGGLNKSINKLDILKTSDRIFDIYFDLTSIKTSLIHPEVHSFRVPDMPVRVVQDYSALDHPEQPDMLRLALAFALKNRDAAFIPRSANDTAFMQRYPLGDDAIQLVCQLLPFQGNMYVSKGLSGIATAVYEGALNIDQLDKTTARIIQVFI